MADLLTGPIREGNRGGLGLFRWENVKEDKYRENYLGHSLRAPVGRWQKGRDLTWYTKDKKEAPAASLSSRDEEIRLIKQAEKEALAEALGFKTEKTPDSSTISQDIAAAIRRTEMESKDTPVDAAVKAADNLLGIGFQTTSRHYSEERKDKQNVLDVRKRKRDEHSHVSRRRDEPEFAGMRGSSGDVARSGYQSRHHSRHRSHNRRN
ncbi:hypothetical protein MERGE_002795 [Pneumocystis wakefieldiae]|uniref:Multiple myeloma tumor-associated protein 2-like N-terminal domain-containing protein n=1 Tax=Pneumocystis wakefieldiae TaxID=38082 RepID=A0A899FXZ8_9ASCO|nr:hypothetical protein MERGE_002795 [Pneumocystis wakefieldiae]